MFKKCNGYALTHIREAGGRQAHGATAQKGGSHDQKIGVWLSHAGADLLDQRKDDEGGNGMGDERGDDEDESSKHDQDTVQRKARYPFRDSIGDRLKEPGGGDSFAKRKTACCEDDDGPEEVVEIFFGENPSTEEQDQGYNGNDAHIAKY